MPTDTGRVAVIEVRFVSFCCGSVRAECGHLTCRGGYAGFWPPLTTVNYDLWDLLAPAARA